MTGFAQIQEIERPGRLEKNPTQCGEVLDVVVLHILWINCPIQF
jgi:hypothetical protein